MKQSNCKSENVRAGTQRQARRCVPASLASPTGRTPFPLPFSHCNSLPLLPSRTAFCDSLDHLTSERFNPEDSVTEAGQFKQLHSSHCSSDIICSPPVQSRKRGKCMSRRTGQNPKVRVKKRSNGKKVFFFQYWIDVPGQEARKRKTYVIGPTSQMTKSEAERKKVEFLLNLELNSMEYQIPSSLTFATRCRTTGMFSHQECCARPRSQLRTVT